MQASNVTGVSYLTALASYFAEIWLGNFLEHEGNRRIPGRSLGNRFRALEVNEISFESHSVPGFDISGIELLDSITGKVVCQNSDFRCLQIMFLRRVRGYDSQQCK
jgi:hypothetical protein